MNPYKLCFLDESAYARSPQGEAAYTQEPYRPEEKVNLLAGLTLEGVVAPWLVHEGSVDTPVFLYYVEHILCPNLKAGSILVLDNFVVHKHSRVRTLLESKDIQVLFLPTYSPDLNPIELAFAKLKSLLRKQAIVTFASFSHAIKQSLDSLSLHEIMAWFRHCGYPIS
jgi:transposase